MQALSPRKQMRIEFYRPAMKRALEMELADMTQEEISLQLNAEGFVQWETNGPWNQPGVCKLLKLARKLGAEGEL